MAAYAGPASPPPADREHITISASRTWSLGDAATQSVINCDIAVYSPHKSTHVPGTINVVATVICDAVVVSLSLDVYLYRGSTLVGDGSNYNEARSAVQANAYSGCTSGTYHGEAFGFIVFPAGYTPWSASGWVYSPSVHIGCP